MRLDLPYLAGILQAFLLGPPPLGLAGSDPASDPGLRLARFTRRAPPWTGLGVSLRDAGLAWGSISQMTSGLLHSRSAHNETRVSPRNRSRGA